MKHSKSLFIIVLTFVLVSINLYSEQKYIDSLESILKNTKNDSSKVDLLIKIANKITNTSYNKANIYFRKADSIAKKNKYYKGIALSNELHANYFYDRDDYNNAIPFLQKAIDAYYYLNNSKRIINIFDMLSYSYFQIADYEEAIKMALQMIKFSKEKNNFHNLSHGYNLLGVINNVYKKNYFEALEYYIQSYYYAEKSKDSTKIANTLVNIADVNSELLNKDDAFNNYLKGLNIYQRIKDTVGIVTCYIMLTKYYIDISELDSASILISKSKVYLAHFNDNKLFAHVLFYNAIINYKRNLYEQAIEQLIQASEIFHKYGDVMNAAMCYERLADIYITKRIELPKAIKYLNEILPLAINSKDYFFLMNVYKCFSSYYEAISDYKNSLNYYKLYNNMEDSVFRKNYLLKTVNLDNKRINEMKQKEIFYLNKEKDYINAKTLFYITGFILVIIIVALLFTLIWKNRKDAILLKEQNRIINDTQQKLELVNFLLAKNEQELFDANLSKDKFMSIIAHDIKNPLQVTLLATELLLTYRDKMSLKEEYKYITSIKDTTNNLFALLETLLQWARAQSGKFDFYPESFDLYDVVEKVIKLQSLASINKSITITHTVPKQSFLQADLNMITSIIRNLVSNSIKFTYPNGSVSISSSFSDGIYTITVIDNGVGINQEFLSKLFRIDIANTTPGTHLEKGSGIGLLLCKEFVEKHRGKIWVDSEVNVGSKFSFTIPKVIR